MGDGGAQSAAHTVRRMQRHEKERGRFARWRQRSNGSQTASDDARSLAPGLEPSHGAGGRGREGTQCEGLAAKSRASLEKCFEGRIRLLRGGLAILL